MKLASFDEIVQALEKAEVHFLVVGGMAVNAHGFLRFTKDVDIVIKLSEKDISSAFAALRGIDYHPSVPITAEQFSIPSLRESWRKDKAMLVLKMWSDRHQETPLDIFVYEPFDFDQEYQRALVDHGNGVPVRFASIPTLIEMKREAGRTQDLKDIEMLIQIAKLGEK